MLSASALARCCSASPVAVLAVCEYAETFLEKIIDEDLEFTEGKLVLRDEQSRFAGNSAKASTSLYKALRGDRGVLKKRPP